jgi:hypothetical protein
MGVCARALHPPPSSQSPPSNTTKHTTATATAITVGVTTQPHSTQIRRSLWTWMKCGRWCCNLCRGSTTCTATVSFIVTSALQIYFSLLSAGSKSQTLDWHPSR